MVRERASQTAYQTASRPNPHPVAEKEIAALASALWQARFVRRDRPNSLVIGTIHQRTNILVDRLIDGWSVCRRTTVMPHAKLLKWHGCG